MSAPLASAPPPAASWLPQSRARRVWLLALAYLALTSLFVVLRFPIDRLTPRVETVASRVSGARVAIGELEFHLVALLPELSARHAVLSWPAGTQLRLDRVRVRPAWSLSWFRGQPSLVLSVRRGSGRIRGTARLGDPPSFRGSATDVDLAQLPPALLGSAGLALDGRLDGTFDIRSGADGPEGTIALRAVDGSLSLSILPMGVPFESLEAALALGGDMQLTVQSLALEGPLVALAGSGTVGRGSAAALAPLQLAARLEVREAALRQLFAGTDIELDRDGVAELSIRGTVSDPVLTAAGPPGAGRRGPATNPAAPRRATNPPSDLR